MTPEQLYQILINRDSRKPHMDEVKQVCEFINELDLSEYKVEQIVNRLDTRKNPPIGGLVQALRRRWNKVNDDNKRITPTPDYWNDNEEGWD